MAQSSEVLFISESQEEKLDSEDTRCINPIIGREPMGVTESALHVVERPQREAWWTAVYIRLLERHHYHHRRFPHLCRSHLVGDGEEVVCCKTRHLPYEEGPAHKHSLNKQAFVRSDCEWRAFQQENEREKNRLREIELRLEERRLNLFEQLLGLGNRVANILENRNVFSKTPATPAGAASALPTRVGLRIRGKG